LLPGRRREERHLLLLGPRTSFHDAGKRKVQRKKEKGREKKKNTGSVGEKGGRRRVKRGLRYHT